jgi:hypothetical protein
MARPEVTGRRIAGGLRVADEADCFTIAEFCRRHRISVPMFYKHRDLMPDTFCVGTRILISREAAARWRVEREQGA